MKTLELDPPARINTAELFEATEAQNIILRTDKQPPKLFVTVPDDTDPVALATIVAAHDPAQTDDEAIDAESMQRLEANPRFRRLVAVVKNLQQRIAVLEGR